MRENFPNGASAEFDTGWNELSGEWQAEPQRSYEELNGLLLERKKKVDSGYGSLPLSLNLQDIKTIMEEGSSDFAPTENKLYCLARGATEQFSPEISNYLANILLDRGYSLSLVHLIVNKDVDYDANGKPLLSTLEAQPLLTGLDMDVAERLIADDSVWHKEAPHYHVARMLADVPEVFSDFDVDDLTERLIQKNKGERLLSAIGRIEGLDEDRIQKAALDEAMLRIEERKKEIESDRAAGKSDFAQGFPRDNTADSLKELAIHAHNHDSNALRQDVANVLVEKFRFDPIELITGFPNLNQAEIVQSFLNDTYAHARYDEDEEKNRYISGDAFIMLVNASKFDQLDHDDFVRKMISRGALNEDPKFEGWTEKYKTDLRYVDVTLSDDVVDSIMESGSAAIKNIFEFRLSGNKLLELYNEETADAIMHNIETFGIDTFENQADLVELMLSYPGYDFNRRGIHHRMEKYVSINKNAVALYLLEKDPPFFVEYMDIGYFHNLNQAVAEKLIALDRINEVHDGHKTLSGYEYFIRHKDEFPDFDFDTYFNNHPIDSIWTAEALGAKLPYSFDGLRAPIGMSLPFEELYLFWRNENQLKAEDGQIDYQKVFELFNRTLCTWQDEQVIAGPMRRGAEVFGMKKMFDYLDKKDGTLLSLHDRTFFFDSVLNIYQMYAQLQSSDNQKNANIFFSNILNQVRMDTGLDEEENESYSRLATIAQNVDFSADGFRKYKERLDEIRQHGSFTELDKIDDLLAGACFDSWKNLQNFAAIINMMERSDIWEKLITLKHEAETSERKLATYEYVKTLLFHPDSKVNVGAAEEFFMDPERFLDRNDEHAPTHIHNRKKPANYIDIPNLDLTATDLVEALTAGDIDKIQTFPGVEIEYSVAARRPESATAAPTALTQRIRMALGSRSEGNANPKLFGELKKLFKESRMNFDLAELDPIESQLAPELLGKIAELLVRYPNQVNAYREQMSVSDMNTKYRVRVYDKHDPKGALAGDDTNCCMPFGSGKNNVYTFNPNCGLVTVEKEKSSGGYITIAQSVLTLDQDVGRRVDGLVAQLDTGDEAVLANLDAAGRNNYIACDNIEVRGNYQDTEHRKIIAALYRDFFSRYAQVFNQDNLTDRTVSNEKIIVGQGYSDYRFGVQMDNTFLPLAPVSYSDKLGEKVDVIELTAPEADLGVTVLGMKTTTAEQFSWNEDLPAEVLPLTYQDSLLATHLESKAYNGSSFIEGISAMENSLIAKDINNAIKDRPNMSFKYGDAGYILAYEGDFELQSYNDEDEGDAGGEGLVKTEHGVYIEDLAVDPENMMAGGKLILAFLGQYKKHYLDAGRPLPIFAQMRESTSYQLVSKHLDSLSRRLRVGLHMEELGTHQVGNDIMHRVVLRV